jgi:hypothetical protein
MERMARQHSEAKARRRFGVLALAFGVLVLGGAVLCAPAGAQTSAAQIDALLQQYNSPMAGMGQTFVDIGAANGVDPAFLVAISGAESTFGENLYSVVGDYATNNAWNWFYAAPWAASDFSSWEDGLNHVAAGIAGPLYYGAGLYSVAAIAPVYCPVGTQNWIDNVSAFMVALGGDPNDTRLNAGASESPAQIAPAQIAPVQLGPAQLDPVVPVTIAPARHRVGRPLTITFAVANIGGQTGSWSGVMLELDGPGVDPVYLAANESFELAPGATKSFSATVRLSAPGRWYGFVQALAPSGPQMIGNTPTFTFAVGAAAERVALQIEARHN